MNSNIIIITIVIIIPLKKRPDCRILELMLLLFETNIIFIFVSSMQVLLDLNNLPS